MPHQSHQFIDPQTLMRIQSLELRAKYVVEGFWNGLNKSPYHGFSVEFTEYRQYSPGDDPRYLDWKLYARSDRYYIRRYEDETNLRCGLILDMSRSMGYGSLPFTKMDYARTLAATLGYFLISQRDAVGLLTFDNAVNQYIPPRFRTGQLRQLMVALERSVSGTETDLGRPLEAAAERFAKRGMLVLISDFLSPIESLEHQLGCLRACGHEVVVFQVIDPAERDFDFEQAALFEDLESGRRIYIDPGSARESYLERFERHCEAIQSACRKQGIAYRPIVTSTPLEQTLAEFLRSRAEAAGAKQSGRRNQPAIGV